MARHGHAYRPRWSLTKRMTDHPRWSHELSKHGRREYPCDNENGLNVGRDHFVLPFRLDLMRSPPRTVAEYMTEMMSATPRGDMWPPVFKRAGQFPARAPHSCTIGLLGPATVQIQTSSLPSPTTAHGPGRPPLLDGEPGWGGCRPSAAARDSVVDVRNRI